MKTRNSILLFFFLPSSFFNFEGSKVGYTIGKKQGNAPFRNRQKRVMREIIRNNNECLKNNHYVIIKKKEGCDLPFSELEKSLLNLIRRIK